MHSLDRSSSHYLIKCMSCFIPSLRYRYSCVLSLVGVLCISSFTYVVMSLCHSVFMYFFHSVFQCVGLSVCMYVCHFVYSFIPVLTCFFRPLCLFVRMSLPLSQRVSCMCLFYIRSLVFCFMRLCLSFVAESLHGLCWWFFMCISGHVSVVVYFVCVCISFVHSFMSPSLYGLCVRCRLSCSFFCPSLLHPSYLPSLIT